MTTTGDLTDSQHLVRVFPDARPGEPVFVLLGTDGSLNVVTLDYIRFVGREVHGGQIAQGQVFRELRMLHPDGYSLADCELMFGEVDGVPTLEIVETSGNHGVLWNCPLED